MGNNYDDSKMNIIKSIKIDNNGFVKNPIVVELYSYNNGKPSIRFCKKDLNFDGSEKSYAKYIKINDTRVVDEFITALQNINDEFKSISN